MAIQPSGLDKHSTIRVLVTGANSGLGFATCCRLIDEFLHTRPQSESLHLLYSTRDTKKREDTLRRLNAHFQATLKAFDGKTPGVSRLLESRIKIEGVLVDLTKLLTVKALAKQLLLRRQRLHAVVWNAGVAGFLGVNWLAATWGVLTGPIQALTYPQFMYPDVGALASRQVGGYGKIHTFEEPQLGQVFTSNVFGHYMLTHWLAPLMDADTRIIWISSIGGIAETFSVEDLQCLRSTTPYEASKRLTDILVLTSDLPSSQPYVRTFLPSSKAKQTVLTSGEQEFHRPRMYLTHPGVVGTSISGLSSFISFFMFAMMYFVRWCGSAWHPVDPYKGAVSMVFAVLATPEQLLAQEQQDGKGKWGSACDVYGNERVARTEVDGWGFGGEVGRIPTGSIPSRRVGHVATTQEARENFAENGRQVWREMEHLRMHWEERLGKVDASDPVDL